VYEVRLLLEPWAVARTARGRGARPAGPEAARVALEQAKGLLDGTDRAALSLANREFHRALYSTCGNDLVTARLDDLQDLTALGTVSVLWQRWPTWREEYSEHEEILAAVEAGAAAQAERLVRGHIRGSLSRLDGAGG
jgi:DNA-binding GntR family transcriptional regulator